jgi:hypothetical protein
MVEAFGKLTGRKYFLWDRTVSIPLPTISEFVLRVLLVAVTIHGAVILLLWVNRPPLDYYPFRQTQTAATIYWILHGGPWIAYETPVLGYPWAIPFEFPVYQLLAAAVARFGISIEAAGRLVGFSFFLATLWPLRILFSELKLSRFTYLGTAVLYLACPLYANSSGAVMIETCAVFSAAMWLALLVRFYTRQSWGAAIGSIVVGSVAVLAKSTTAASFAFVAMVVAVLAVEALRDGEHFRSGARKLFLSALLVGLPLIVGFIWVAYSDHIKSANEFGALTTSASLAAWNFGTVEQRLSESLWVEVILRRSLGETFGAAGLVAIVILGFALTSRRTTVAAIVAIVGFLCPFLVFTNLHMVHGYYQAANAIFLITAVGIGLGRLLESGRPAIALAVLMTILGGQYLFFYRNFVPLIATDYSDDQRFAVANIAREKTTPDQALIVFGDDWSSAIDYFSQRKTLTIPYWAPKPLIERVLADPQHFLGERHLGGVVSCDENLGRYSAESEIKVFLAVRSELGRFGGCRFIAP